MGAIVFRELEPADDSPVQNILLKEIPMNVPLRQDVFYNRTCYREYYSSIINSFEIDGMSQISVTGTPGIGKSVFYLYFVQRYRREHPKSSIMTAAFNDNNELISCRLFHSGADHVGKEYSVFPLEINTDLLLIDGPPRTRPRKAAQKMVCFTSPNETWFSSMKTSPYHIRMFMPVWDLDELLEANEHLGLKLEVKTIQDRFHLFGGVPRYCISVSPNFVLLAQRHLSLCLSALDNFDTMKGFFQNKSDLEYVFHIFPESIATGEKNLPLSYQYKFASESVFAAVNKATESLDQKERNVLANMVQHDWETRNLLS